MFRFDIAGAQIDGARDYQEDAFLISRVGESADSRGSALLIVADGMGGHAAGNVASNMAVQTFNKFITARYPSDDLSRIMREAVRQANLSITETVRETVALKGMGCTLVAAMVDEAHLRWISVGDSHLYLARDGELKKLNADHSYGGFLDRMAAAGKPVEPEPGFSRNMLMSALTGEDIAEIDCPEFALDLKAGDRIVVASDGLDTLSSRKVLELLGTSTSARECSDNLLKAVQEAGLPRQDNTTTVVMFVDEPREVRPAVEDEAATPQEPSLNLGRRGAEDSAEESDLEDASAKRGRRIPFLIAGLAGLGALGWALLQQSGPEQLPEQNKPPVVAVAPSAEKPADEKSTDSDAQVAEPPPPVLKLPRMADAIPGGRAPEVVVLPAGTFQMGSPDSASEFDERPRRPVKLQSFAIGVTEVTVADYLRFVSATGRKPPRRINAAEASAPVAFVTWLDAVAYSEWLSSVTGQRYRLPTEAEWEYAARGNQDRPYWWGSELGEKRAHCMVCASGFDLRKPAPVGQFPPNPFGLHDTAGNVEEWVADCYKPSYKDAPADGKPVEKANCRQRVVRGGAFSSGPRGLRSMTRGKFSPTSSNDSIGFRILREVTGP